MALILDKKDGEVFLIKALVSGAMAAAATVDIALPENSKDVAFVQLYDASGNFVAPGATTYSAKITAQTRVYGKNALGKVTITAGSGGIADGSVIAMTVVQ